MREIDGKALEREVLAEASWDDEDARSRYIEWAVGELKAHDTLVELDGIDTPSRGCWPRSATGSRSPAR